MQMQLFSFCTEVCVLHLNAVYDVEAVEAGPQLADGGSVDVLQPGEEPAVQICPVLLQTRQIMVLNQMLKLIDDFINLEHINQHLHYHILYTCTFDSCILIFECT